MTIDLYANNFSFLVQNIFYYHIFLKLCTKLKKLFTKNKNKHKYY